MGNLIENTSPKSNPKTTILGYIVVSIAILMALVKYILPVFYTLKQDVPYHWYEPIAVLAIGILLIFMNDKHFDRLFNRGDKYLGKVSGTDKKEE